MHMTIQADTLEGARKREKDVLRDAIALLPEGGILARPEQRSRRPTLEERDRILTLAADRHGAMTPSEG